MEGEEKSFEVEIPEHIREGRLLCSGRGQGMTLGSHGDRPPRVPSSVRKGGKKREVSQLEGRDKEEGDGEGEEEEENEEE
uniref:Uncharacterized protein n=1 Tax=Vespula pensylvanica TaxID=30213 RepID=A0A834P1E2_VESPE|nr:hypothetical protein H0235_007478 [Vespula pensylvanica]